MLVTKWYKSFFLLTWLHAYRPVMLSGDALHGILTSVVSCLCAAGVIDSQQQQLHLATKAHEKMVSLMAQQGAPQTQVLTQHTLPHHLSCQPLSLPGTGQCSTTGCSCRIPSDSTTSSSTCSDSPLEGSLTGSCSSTATSVAGCSAGGSDWAVTVQPPGSLGTHVRVTVSRHSGKPAAGCPEGSTECAFLSCSGPGSSVQISAHPELCHTDGQADGVPHDAQALKAGLGLPSVAGHRSSCYEGMCFNRAPGAPLIEGSN